MPTIRADIIEAHLFRRPTDATDAIDLLQLRRVGDPMHGTWQPVMGHIEAGETAVDCMWRELREETGLERAHAAGAWALEQIHPFFIAKSDEIVLGPRFAVEVPQRWTPTLNHEHDASRWVRADEADQRFLWPGQHTAITELRAMLANPARLAALRLPGP